MEHIKLSIYISGAHCAGKTTLQQALLKHHEFGKFGFKGQEEIARNFIKLKGHTKEYLRDTCAFYKFQKELLHQQIIEESMEITENNGVYSRFLWDRGIVDALLYVKIFIGEKEVNDCIRIPAVAREIERLKNGNDTMVFVPRPEKEFLIMDDVRRESDIKEIMKLHHGMIELLTDLNIKHVVINEFDLKQRVLVVLKSTKVKWPWVTHADNNKLPT